MMLMIISDKIYAIYLINMRLFGGERGIRTLDTLLTYTHFPGVRFRPLSHFTKNCDYFT